MQMKISIFGRDYDQLVILQFITKQTWLTKKNSHKTVVPFDKNSPTRTQKYCTQPYW